MTLRQTLLKVFYQLIMKAGKIRGSKNLLLYNSSNARPPVSFYKLQATANNGTTINFEQFKGKKVLLIDKNKNGWNNQPPTWNFSKYLVNEEGILTSYFDPSISPVSYLVINAIKTELKWAVIKSKK